MGIYIDRIKNMSVDSFNFTETFQNDTITPAIESSNTFTKGYLPAGALFTIWISLLFHLSNRENLFDLTFFQALVSLNALIYTLALTLVYLEILTVSQHFITLSCFVFVVNVIGLLRSA